MRRRALVVRAAASGALALSVLAGCAGPHDAIDPGAAVTGDPAAVFATLSRRPDIDQATRRYEQLAGELRRELSAAVPGLTPWQRSGGELRSACGADYPGIGDSGETRDLPTYVVPTGLSDQDWERALATIGQVARRYGFIALPQRLHDSPGDHDAVFHNVHDDGSITLGTARNTVLGVSLGCHLTAAAKRRGR